MGLHSTHQDKGRHVSGRAQWESPVGEPSGRAQWESPVFKPAIIKHYDTNMVLSQLLASCSRLAWGGFTAPPGVKVVMVGQVGAFIL
jgi:hypothetical protein